MLEISSIAPGLSGKGSICNNDVIILFCASVWRIWDPVIDR